APRRRRIQQGVPLRRQGAAMERLPRSCGLARRRVSHSTDMRALLFREIRAIGRNRAARSAGLVRRRSTVGFVRVAASYSRGTHRPSVERCGVPSASPSARCGMLYAILCYEAEDIGWWSSALDDAIMNDRARRESGLAIRGEIGPVVWLMPTTTALTIRSGRRRVVLDGPYAETKEQLLGLYVVDCDSLTEAIDTAMALAQGSGTMEIRPI